MDITLIENEHIEYLSKTVGVVVSKEHTFGTDAILLADFAAPKTKDIACDLGTGCGIVPFLFYRDGVQKTVAVEIQQNACAQVSRSIKFNSAENEIKLINSNLKDIKNPEYNGKFDLVTMNPPYKKAGSGIKNDGDSARIARHETECTLEDISACAARLLKFGGRFCVCGRPERLFETMNEMHRAKIEPKRLRTVHKNSFSAPWLFLLEGRYGGKSGMTVMNPLYIETDDGKESKELLSILGKYREETAE